MARIIRAPGHTEPDSQRRVKHRGAFYIRETRWGPVAQAWPRKRPNWKNPVNLQQRADFTARVRAQQAMMAEDQVGAMGLSTGSLFMWRDVLNRALVGRWIDFDPIAMATSQEILDDICNTVGALLVRTSTGWACLLPDAAGKVLTDNGPGVPPSYQPASGGGGGGGLWSEVLSALPTQAGTGFSTWLNQGSAATVDAATGLVISAPSNGGSFGFHGLYKTAPTAPYKVHALLCYSGPLTNFNLSQIGWYDGTNKVQCGGTVQNTGAMVGTYNFNSPTSFGSNTFLSSLLGMPMVWIELEDDSTNFAIRYSFDGVTWSTAITGTKSGGFLGSSGYSNIVFGISPDTAACSTTLLSYVEI